MTRFCSCSWQKKNNPQLKTTLKFDFLNKNLGCSNPVPPQLYGCHGDPPGLNNCNTGRVKGSTLSWALQSSEITTLVCATLHLKSNMMGCLSPCVCQACFANCSFSFLTQMGVKHITGQQDDFWFDFCCRSGRGGKGGMKRSNPCQPLSFFHLFLFPKLFQYSALFLFVASLCCLKL